ncbi:MAG: hypothetical protein RL095_603 [Verrucomicrobiota bacterium]|jgi:RNA polymerase sigma-70 factor (ECF subfamily)
MATSPHTRLTLLQRIRSGDEGGWLEFYELYRPLILWLARRRGLRDQESCQMLVQAVMRHFASAEWSHDPEKGQFRSLLLRITSFKIHEVLRELQPLQSRQLTGRDAAEAIPAGKPMEQIEAPPADTDEHQESLDRGLEILMADEDVDPRHLQVLLLSLEGLSLIQITERTKLGLSNVKIIRHRLLARLKQIVGECL